MTPGKNAWQTRAFAADDLAAVSEVVHRSIEVSYAGVYPPRAVAHFHEHHTAGKIAADAEAGLTLVIERDGRIVGTVTLVGGEISRAAVGGTSPSREKGRGVRRPRLQ